MKKKAKISSFVLFSFSLGFLAFWLYHDVRRTSEDSAIEGNLAQVASAADQFFRDHEEETCSFDDLVGPGKYLQSILVIRRENYRDTCFPIRRGFGEVSVTTENGRVITRSHR